LPELPVVMIVEDDVPSQMMVHDVLKDGGFDVVAVGSGEEALKLLQSGVVKCSAVATDVNLGDGITGWDVAKQAIDRGTAIIYMTGADADQWPSQGVPGSILLEKPFAPAQLVTAVSQLLNTGTPSTM
jgi:CheY-like chemotaxis protein